MAKTKISELPLLPKASITSSLVLAGEQGGTTYKISGEDVGGGGGKYSGVLYVDAVNGDDLTGRPNDPAFPYETIAAAADDANALFVAKSVPALLWVQSNTTYNEGSITRNGVDMYFEDGAVVYHQTLSIIDDLDASLSGGGGEFNIYGLGTFATLEANSSNDRDTINLRRSTNAYVQAKDIGNINQWNNQSSKLIVEDAIIRQRINVQSTQTAIFRGCKILSPVISSQTFTNDSTSFYDCKIHLLADYSFATKAAELWTITDVQNATTIDYIDPSVSGSSYLNEYQTPITSHANLIANYAPVVGRQTFTACVEVYITGADGQNLYFENCQFNIERDYCIGVTVLQNVATSAEEVIFKGCVIRDISVTGGTAGLLAGKSGTVTTEMKVDLNGITSGAEQRLTSFGSYTPFVNDYKRVVEVSTEGQLDETPTTTSVDGDTTDITLLKSSKGYISVFVNGEFIPVGDGVKTKECYFSDDAGVTAKAIVDIVSGDTLYWNGSIAGFELSGTDKISLIHLI